MARYSIVEAKNKFSSLVEAAEAGEEVVITRHGKPVMQFVPPLLAAPGADADWALRRDAAMARLAELRASIPYSPINSVDIIRQLRDEGP
jgi:prevent-host-death family protein